MKALFEKYKWLQLVIGLVILTAGVIATILAIDKGTSASRVLGIIVAVCFFAYSALLVIVSFVKNRRTPFPVELLIAAILISIGIALCFEEVTNGLTNVMFWLIPSFLTVLGALALVKAIVIMCYKDPVGNWLLTLIIGVVSLTGGILIFCFPNEVKDVLNIIISLLIVVVGLIEVILGIVRLISSGKKAKKEKAPKAIE